jgi:hypothetical protein
MSQDPLGPASSPALIPGRFPLSVERHVMSMADRLVPGVTTVTLNARYYCWHGLVAAEVKSRRWTIRACTAGVSVATWMPSDRTVCVRCSGWHPGLDEVWIVGDTPRDLACARAVGVHCALVATG